jgi:hypothetical protein
MDCCECDWTYHKRFPCPNAPAKHGNVSTSPRLCTPCLYICEGERDEANERMVTHWEGQEAPAEHGVVFMAVKVT